MHHASALAEARSSPFELAEVRFYAALLHQLRREAWASESMATATLALATEHELHQWVDRAKLLQGWAWTMQGDGHQGQAQLQQALSATREVGIKVGQPRTLFMVAEAHRHLGEAPEALLLSEARQLVEQTGERWCEAEVYRLEGECLLWQVPQQNGQAEACFQRALDVARQQQAKSLELRAAMSLSRLWLQQDRFNEVRELLKPIYDGFTEGFDTADLQEAKALLADLPLDSIGTPALFDGRAEAATPLLPRPSPDLPKPGVQSQAMMFLQTLLADGPVASTVVLREAKAAGLSEKTLHRAKDRLGIGVAREHRGQGQRGRGRWVWYLAEDQDV